MPSIKRTARSNSASISKKQKWQASDVSSLDRRLESGAETQVENLDCFTETPSADPIALRRESGYLDFSEALAYLDCEKSFLYRLMSSNVLAYHRAGRKRFFRLADLNAYLSARRREIFRKGQGRR